MKMVDTPQKHLQKQKNIGASPSQNTSDTSSIKECNKYDADKPGHDE